MHWSAQFLGKKWVSGARGPDTFDCWGLLYWIYLTRLNINLPKYPGVEAKDHNTVSGLIEKETSGSPFSKQWHQISKPVNLCGVAMGLTRLTHVGVYIETDGGLVLHTASRHNCIAQSVKALRLSGFSRIEFYKHGEHC